MICCTLDCERHDFAPLLSTRIDNEPFLLPIAMLGVRSRICTTAGDGGSHTEVASMPRPINSMHPVQHHKHQDMQRNAVKCKHVPTRPIRENHPCDGVNHTLGEGHALVGTGGFAAAESGEGGEGGFIRRRVAAVEGKARGGGVGNRDAGRPLGGLVVGGGGGWVTIVGGNVARLFVKSEVVFLQRSDFLPQ